MHIFPHQQKLMHPISSGPVDSGNIFFQHLRILHHAMLNLLRCMPTRNESKMKTSSVVHLIEDLNPGSMMQELRFVFILRTVFCVYHPNI